MDQAGDLKLKKETSHEQFLFQINITIFFMDQFQIWPSYFIPISHKYWPLWPLQVKLVHHFHRFWTIDTKIHDFVCIDVCQVPVKSFLTFSKKCLKNLALKFWRSIFFLSGIMAHTRVIMPFQSLYGIGLIVGALKCVKMIYGLFH